MQIKNNPSTIYSFLLVAGYLKAEKDCSQDKLKELSQTALQQIHDRRYDTEMSAKGVTKIFKYGVAFCGKNVEITAE